MTNLSPQFDVTAVLTKHKFFARFFGGNTQPHDKKARSRDSLSREDRFTLRHNVLMNQVFEFLAKTGLDPIPDHYELAWHYLTCSSSI